MGIEKVKSEKEIIREITEFVDKQTGLFRSLFKRYKHLYIGITNNIDRRLFGDHCVDPNLDDYIFFRAYNRKVAGRIEKHFLNIGLDGGPGGGKNAVFVYVYRISSWTKQRE